MPLTLLLAQVVFVANYLKSFLLKYHAIYGNTSIVKLLPIS